MRWVINSWVLFTCRCSRCESLTTNSEVVRETIVNSEAKEMQLASFFSVMTSFLLWASTHLGFPGDSDGKESACNARDPRFDPWVGKTTWRRAWQPTPVFLPGESHGQRSLVGYSPWGHKESNMTEWLSTHTQPITNIFWQKKKKKYYFQKRAEIFLY